MEDPKRLRTKLRLDLSDVRKQIESLEKIIQKDKSEDNIQALEKLVEYEEKLKVQYEKMTGITLDQATSLSVVNLVDTKKSIFPSFLGIIAGLLFGWAFYNTVLHGITGYAPTDLLDYFTGSENSVSSPYELAAGIGYSSSSNLIIYPLAAAAVLLLLRGVLANQRYRVTEFFDSLALLIAAAFLPYLIQTSDTTAELVTNFEDNLLIWGLSLFVAGIVISLSAFGVKGIFSKIIKASIGILILYCSVQLILITFETETSELQELVWQWPWIIVPLVLAGFLTAFYDFLQIFSIKKFNKSLSEQ